MSELTVPKGYAPVLNVYETQTAIGMIKRVFEDKLAGALNLKRVSAPLFVEPQTGLNDDLNGVERPVEFDVREIRASVQIVQSLAKWKRMALHKYGFPVGEGLYTDMNAIRRDEDMDNLHSIYVDQWDWEKVIDQPARNLETLKETVRGIVGAICGHAGCAVRGVSGAHGAPEAGRSLRHHAGTGRHVPCALPQGAGNGLPPGTQDRLHPCDWGSTPVGDPARRQGAGLRRLGAERGHPLLERSSGVRVRGVLHGHPRE